MKKRNISKRGLTLLEVTIVSGLMSFLAIMLSTTWIGIGRPTVDVVIRSGIFQEMDTAVSALSRDLGGSLGGPEGRLGDKTKNRWVGWMKPADGQLWLCYDGGTDPNGEPDWGTPDTVIVYQIESNSLIRRNQNTDSTFIVADKLTDFAISEEGNAIDITLTFQNRDISRSCSLMVRTP